MDTRCYTDLIGPLTLVLTNCIHLIYRLWWTPDTWLYNWLDTYYYVCYPHYCLFTLFMPFLISVYTFSLSAHMLYAHALFNLFHSFTRSFDSLDLHIQICGYLLLIRYLERITCVMRSWSLSFLDHKYSCSFILLISWFYLYHVQLSFLSFIHLLSLY